MKASLKELFSRLWYALGILAALLSLLLTTVLTFRVWHDRGELRKVGEEITALREDNTRLSSKVRVLAGQAQRQADEIHARDQLMSETVRQKELALAESHGSKLQLQQIELDKLQKETAIVQLAHTLRDALAKEIKAEQFQVIREGDAIRVRLADTVLFRAGDEDLTDAGRKVLLSLANCFNGPVKDYSIRVEGHTDGTPVGRYLRSRFPTNWELSAARAVTSVRFLQEQGKVEATRLSAEGLSSTRPLDTEESKEANAKNRRVEFLLAPSPSITAAQSGANS